MIQNIDDITARVLRRSADAIRSVNQGLSKSLLTDKLGSQPELLLALHDTLAPAGERYDLIVIDCPPAGTTITNLAMAAAHGLIVPMRLDGFSLKSLEDIDEQYQAIKNRFNSTLELFGIVLFDVPQNATRMQGTMEQILGQVFGGQPPLFTTTIRHAGAAALQMSLNGVLAHEYEAAAEAYWSSTNVGERIIAGSDYSVAAPGLAEDYTNLAQEILALIGAENRPSEPSEVDVIVDLIEAEQVEVTS